MRKYHEHPSYDDALRQAVKLASQAEISRTADARVWYSPESDSIGVSSEANGYGPQTMETVAYAQRWDENTVQLRFMGGHSEFVKI